LELILVVVQLRNLKRNNIKKDYRLRLTKAEHDLIKEMRVSNGGVVNNVLVIGDLHEPFCLDKYLEFCVSKYEQFDCTEVVFIGDIIDNHYSSYHETSADGMGGADELELSIKRIARWYKEFPKATVIIGNHDRMIMRKAQTSAIPSKWIKSYKEVLEVPNWNFVERYVKDGVQYLHGEGGTARTKCRADMQNTVQGHLHTQAYCESYVGQNFRVFGMQVGCGIDHESYAMAYAKYGKKPAIGCAVVLNNGKLPINLLMEL
jgi:metallophosphoesterase superfamily enzyme|tara:strand:- start:19 stop:801 length:783 start_codon:yes stop_codon:yes gene_type:complete